jgi:hypothetical protein
MSREITRRKSNQAEGTVSLKAQKQEHDWHPQKLKMDRIDEGDKR